MSTGIHDAWRPPMITLDRRDFPDAIMNEPVPSSPTANDPMASELNRRAVMLHAIGETAKRLVGDADWRAGIQELLDRLGKATGVSRVSRPSPERVFDFPPECR